MGEVAFANVEDAAKFELGFWLQVLGDHARFIHDALAADERDALARAAGFIRSFDALLASARSGMAGNAAEVSKVAFQQALELRHFKLILLGRHLEGKIKLGLSPSFLNHMVNEAEEALAIMRHLQEGRVPPLQGAVHHHLLWLQDAYGHSASVACKLDFAEQRLKQMSDDFTKHFQELHLKAVELAGYARTGLASFPALHRFNREAELEMLLFMEFLKELQELGITKEMLGTLMPLMADHMFREECYYLTKLSGVSQIESPNCDPAKPRTEA